MRVIRTHEPGVVTIDTVPDPEPGAPDVLVRVHACGLCGTDLSYVKHGGVGGPGPEPLALGHELSGVIEAVGTGVDGFAVGDRVVVHPGNDELGRIGNGAPEGGLSDLVLVRQAQGRLLRVPEGMDLTYAALTEPVAVGMHAAERLELAPGAKVVVVGCGPVGMAALASLLDAGAASVVAIDPGETRRRIALELGAEAALDPFERGMWKQLSEIHGRHPSGSPLSNAYIEASGSAEMLNQVISRAAPRSRICVPAVHLQDVTISMLVVLMKELEIRGAIEYPDRFEDALDLLARRDLSPMLTDLVSLEDAAAALMDPAAMRAAGKTMAIVDGAH